VARGTPCVRDRRPRVKNRRSVRRISPVG